MVEVIDVNEIDDLVSSIWLLISTSLLTCFPCSQNPARAHQHLQTPSSTSSHHDQCSQLQLFYLNPSFLCKPHTLKASIWSSMLWNNVIWLVLYNLVRNSSDSSFRILQSTHQIPCPSSVIHLWLAHVQQLKSCQSSLNCYQMSMNHNWQLKHSQRWLNLPLNINQSPLHVRQRLLVARQYMWWRDWKVGQGRGQGIRMKGCQYNGGGYDPAGAWQA